MCICTYRSVSNEERTVQLVLLYCRLMALVVERQKSKFSNSHEFIYLHHFNGHLKCQQRRCCASIYIYIVIIKICKKLLENAYMLNSYFSCSNITSLVLLMINEIQIKNHLKKPQADFLPNIVTVSFMFLGIIYVLHYKVHRKQ